LATTRSEGRRARTVLLEAQRLLGAQGPPARQRKRAVLAALATARFVRARDLVCLQRVICFLTAFPDDAAIRRGARRLADLFHNHVLRLTRAQRALLDDSGMAGTVTRHVYCAGAARWLVRRFGADAEVDWAAFSGDSAARLLAGLLHPLESDAVEFTAKTTRAWLERARGAHTGTVLAWLLAQAPAGGAGAARFRQAYDDAEVPLAWRLGDGRAGITRNLLRTRVAYRAQGMRRAAAGARAAITQPLDTVTPLARAAALRLLDVWRAALWSRTRTVLHIERPNPDECYRADFGGGLQMAAIGIEPAARGLLEPSFGYLLLANGVPIGYGGFTPLFAQVNTGTNIFPEFRGSEAAFAFQQALRLMHALTGCVRFLVNPYQFGAGNDEALQSGAYWFYYRLGFRSAQAPVRRLAEREFARLRADRRYRVPVATLRKLAACDLHLDLADDAAARFFDEAWLPALVDGVTGALAREQPSNRAAAQRTLAARLARTLGIALQDWSAQERAGFERFAPLLAQIDDLDRWPAADRQALAGLCRARWAPQERDYARRLCAHERLRQALARAAQRSGEVA
jgi:hypothetical protein